jgi:hypothetical protein
MRDLGFGKDLSIIRGSRPHFCAMFRPIPRLMMIAIHQELNKGSGECLTTKVIL